ncbi:hypothetical protein Rhopal_003346-T1 [Rhodotorula paludigena]|uniref:Zn(2)-C6 fungal-type domain-containing protein n=1 Tax=Rhodotorula paludigena TaxID=86838 RepID=A0AAV5GMS4_9BASI|nr:hypothetical protein Rhopal_003346-T1 [Rhodotorula paludigena]
MPPDRTASATSFTEAQALGLPLSSHGAKHAPSIQRGNACQTCRRRKLKCDGVKPLCGACRKSAVAHGDDAQSIACIYDDPNAPKKKRASPGSKVAALEAEIAELKSLIAQSRLTSPPVEAPPAASTSTSYAPYLSQTDGGLPNPITNPNPVSFTAKTPYYPMSTASSSPTFGANTMQQAFTSLYKPQETLRPDNLSPPATLNSMDLTPPVSPPEDPFLEVFYPGWPRDLPTPALTLQLVEVFFSRPHIGSGIVNPARFRTAMTLPPTSLGFPHPALIHIICALAGMMVSDDFFASEERYWRGFDKPSEYHAARCKVALEGKLGFGDTLFQIAQVFALLTYWCYTNARFVELWLYCGQATRVGTPLGLNHLRAKDDKGEEIPAFYKGHLLSETNDESVLEERAMTFWAAVMSDRFASSSTGWACSLDDVDITTVIPAAGTRYPRGEEIESSLNSLHNPHFFIAHPQHLCKPPQLFIKAVVLMGKVVQFQQRAPYAPKQKNMSYGLNDPISDIRQTDAFRRLVATVKGFISSIPREYQFPQCTTAAEPLDTLSVMRLALVHGMSHCSHILLHEPYVATLEETDQSMTQCMKSANEILNVVFAVLGTFVRKMAILQLQGITEGVQELQNNVTTILTVLKAHRTPLGDVTHSQLAFLFADPMRCLPRPFLNLANLPVPSGPDPMTGCQVVHEYTLSEMAKERNGPPPSDSMMSTSASASTPAGASASTMGSSSASSPSSSVSPAAPLFTMSTTGIVELSGSTAPDMSGLWDNRVLKRQLDSKDPTVVHELNAGVDVDRLLPLGTFAEYADREGLFAQEDCFEDKRPQPDEAKRRQADEVVAALLSGQPAPSAHPQAKAIWESRTGLDGFEKLWP